MWRIACRPLQQRTAALSVRPLIAARPLVVQPRISQLIRSTSTIVQCPKSLSTTVIGSTPTTTTDNRKTGLVPPALKPVRSLSTATGIAVPVSPTGLIRRLFKRWDAKPSDDDKHLSRQTWRDNPISQWFRNRGGGGGGSGGRDWTVHIILGINTAVFLLWTTLGSDPYGRKLMNNHFTLSLWNLKNHRYHTLITHAFSQSNLMHFAMNSITLWFMGPSILGLLGRSSFLVFYFGAAMTGAAAHLSEQLWGYAKYGPRYRETRALGGSGAGMGLVTLYACMAPQSTFYMYFIPVPAWLCAGGLVAYDLYGAMRGNDGVAHTGHLGGAAFGAAYYLLRLRRGRF